MMVPRPGLEPGTYWLRTSCSTHLNYRGMSCPMRARPHAAGMCASGAIASRLDRARSGPPADDRSRSSDRPHAFAWGSTPAPSLCSASVVTSDHEPTQWYPVRDLNPRSRLERPASWTWLDERGAMVAVLVSRPEREWVDTACSRDADTAMVEMAGLEPARCCLQSRRSATELHPHGGPGRKRSDDLSLFRRALCQLSYRTMCRSLSAVTPLFCVDATAASPRELTTSRRMRWWTFLAAPVAGLEPAASRSVVERSIQLSYTGRRRYGSGTRR